MLQMTAHNWRTETVERKTRVQPYQAAKEIEKRISKRQTVDQTATKEQNDREYFHTAFRE